MARIRKSTSALNLYKYDVLIDDRGTRSDYFKISQFDGYFYGGRNAFLIAGASTLKINSRILIEILNADGKPVYSAPIPQFIEGNSRLVQVEIYRDTPIGPGKLVILGCTDKYIDGTPIPEQWKDKFNVRWTTDVIISPRVENRTPIRFAKKPSIQVTEKFYFEPSASSFTQKNQVPLDIEFQPIFQNVFPNGYLLKVLGPNTTSQFSSEYEDAVITGSLTYTSSVVSDTINVRLPITKIFNKTLAETKGSLLYTDKKLLLLNGLFSSSNIYSTKIDPLGQVDVSGSLSLEYDKLETFNTNYEVSFARIRIVNLSTLSGEIHKVRISYKPTAEPGEYVALGDVNTTVSELFAVDTASKIVDTGKFVSELLINDYWYHATMSLKKNEIDPILPDYYKSSSLVTTYITASQLELIDSINVTPQIVSNKYINDVSYFIGNRESNPIVLFPNSEYTLAFDAIANKFSGSVELNQSDYSLEVYLIDQPGNGQNVLDTNRRGQLLGTITPNATFVRQNFENTQINFVPNIRNSGPFGIRFVFYGGYWSIANVSVKAAQEAFFSPDEVDILLQNVNYRNKILTFKADYLDINNNSIGVSTFSTPTYFSGSQTTPFDSSSVASSSYAATASYALNAGDPFPYTGSAIISGSLTITGSLITTADLSVNTGSVIISGSLIVTGSTRGTFTGSLFGTSSVASIAVSSSFATTSSRATSASFAATASRAITASYALNAAGGGGAGFPFSGNAVITGSLYVTGSGSSILEVVGAAGTLLNISDGLSGSLMNISDISGIPIFEVFSDHRVVMGTLNSNTLVVTGSRIGVRKTVPTETVDVSGSVLISGSLRVSSGITGSVQSSSYAVTASYALNGGGSSAPTFPYTGSAIISGSLIITGSLSADISSAYALSAMSSSYALTASYALNGGGGGITGGTANYIPIWNNATEQSSSVLHQSSNNIGLGTTSPTKDFDVRRTKSGGEVGLRIRNDAASNPFSDAVLNIEIGGTGGGDPFITLNYGGSSGWAIGADQSDNDSLKISHGSSFRPGIGDIVSITTGSNVGIGTQLPAAKLHVQGNVSASSFTGSLFGTASWAENAISASYSLSASYAPIASVEWDSILNKPSGIVSSSIQVVQSLPVGTVSSSAQINTGSFTGSFSGAFAGDGSGLVGVTAVSTLAGRTIISASVPAVLVNQISTGSIGGFGKSFIIFSTQVNTDVRIRLYGSQSYVTNDLFRSIGTDPSDNAGVIMDLILSGSPSLYNYTLSPIVNGANMDPTPSATIYYAVTNLSTVTSNISMSFNRIILE